MSKRTLVISDCQIPYDDRKALKAVIRAIGEIQPDELVHIGDLMDNPTPSRWSKGTAGEFAQQVKDDIKQVKERFIGPVRDVYDGPFGVHEGNHDCAWTHTKAVTARGFVHVDDLTLNDLVLSVDDAGNSVWQAIDEVVRFPFSGELYTVGGSQGVTGAFTENHRLVGLSDKSREWAEHTPEEFGCRRLWAYTAGNGGAKDGFVSDDEIRLTAWALTDSHRMQDGRWAFYQSGPGSERIKLLLKGLGIESREYVRNRDIEEIDGKVLKSAPQTQYEFHIGRSEFLDDLVPSRNRIPEWMFGMSERQVRLFIDEYVFCDGSSTKRNSRVIYVCRSELRDDLRMLMVQNGIRATVTEYRPGHFRLNICDRQLTGIYKQDIKKVPYEGDVWCLRVPNGRFFVEQDGRVHLTGNSRPRDYLTKYAPALAEFEDTFHFENLLSFDDYDVKLLPAFYEIAPGWISTHGHLGQISLSRIAGNTALGAARKFGKSVVMGHTHRMGVLSESKGYNGRITSQVTGFEVGNLMDMRMAQYLRSGAGNWQQGFGILTIAGQHVTPQPVPIVKGKFSVDGHVWEV